MAASTGLKLRRFRKKLGLGLREAARQLHVKHPALDAWEADRAVPSKPYREAIEVWTGGDVKETDWPLNDGEREAIEHASHVRPAKPNSAA